MVRKSPIKHPVRAHIRDGVPVDNYVRGDGNPNLPSIKLPDPTLSLKLPEMPTQLNDENDFEMNNENGLDVQVSDMWDGGKSIYITGLSDEEIEVIRQAESDKINNVKNSEALLYYYQQVLPKIQSSVEPEVYEQIPTGKFWASNVGNELQIEIPKFLAEEGTQ